MDILLQVLKDSKRQLQSLKLYDAYWRIFDPSVVTPALDYLGGPVLENINCFVLDLHLNEPCWRVRGERRAWKRFHRANPGFLARIVSNMPNLEVLKLRLDTIYEPEIPSPALFWECLS